MKPGEWVRHKLDRQYYSVKKIGDKVAVLNCQQPFETTVFHDEVRIVICQIKNIEPVEQLSLI